MDWNKAEKLLVEMSLVYNKDNIRKITYNREIFPLSMRFSCGERTEELYERIDNIYNQLIYKPNFA